jgi:hypothetical protein
MRSTELASTATNNTVAAAKHTVDTVVARTMASCLRCRSTKVPNAGPTNAEQRLKAPPTTPVATTERVSR